MSAKVERALLISEYGYTKEDVDQLSDEQVKNMVAIESGEIIDVTEEETPVKIEEHVQEVPKMTSPEWNDYVLSQFVSEELRGGNPTVDGLRRVTELLIGPVVESKTKVLQVPVNENEGRATVVVTITIFKDVASIHNNKLHPNIIPVVYSGAADAYHGNIQHGFERYPVALAETRAEGRAYRKALRIRNIAAEEAGINPEAPADESKLIAPLNVGQITAMDLVARGSNLNVEKVIKKLKEDGILEYNDIRKLSESDGQQIMKAVSAYNGDRASIPVELVGYTPDWRKNV